MRNLIHQAAIEAVHSEDTLFLKAVWAPEFHTRPSVMGMELRQGVLDDREVTQLTSVQEHYANILQTLHTFKEEHPGITVLLRDQPEVTQYFGSLVGKINEAFDAQVARCREIVNGGQYLYYPLLADAESYPMLQVGIVPDMDEEERKQREENRELILNYYRKALERRRAEVIREFNEVVTKKGVDELICYFTQRLAVIDRAYDANLEAKVSVRTSIEHCRTESNEYKTEVSLPAAEKWLQECRGEVEAQGADAVESPRSQCYQDFCRVAREELSQLHSDDPDYVADLKELHTHIAYALVKGELWEDVAVTESGDTLLHIAARQGLGSVLAWMLLNHPRSANFSFHHPNNAGEYFFGIRYQGASPVEQLMSFGYCQLACDLVDKDAFTIDPSAALGLGVLEEPFELDVVHAARTSMGIDASQIVAQGIDQWKERCSRMPGSQDRRILLLCTNNEDASYPEPFVWHLCYKPLNEHQHRAVPEGQLEALCATELRALDDMFHVAYPADRIDVLMNAILQGNNRVLYIGARPIARALEGVHQLSQFKGEYTEYQRVMPRGAVGGEDIREPASVALMPLQIEDGRWTLLVIEYSLERELPRVFYYDRANEKPKKSERFLPKELKRLIGDPNLYASHDGRLAIQTEAVVITEVVGQTPGRQGYELCKDKEALTADSGPWLVEIARILSQAPAQRSPLGYMDLGAVRAEHEGVIANPVGGPPGFSTVVPVGDGAALPRPDASGWVCVRVDEFSPLLLEAIGSLNPSGVGKLEKTRLLRVILLRIGMKPERLDTLAHYAVLNGMPEIAVKLLRAEGTVGVATARDYVSTYGLSLFELMSAYLPGTQHLGCVMPDDARGRLQALWGAQVNADVARQELDPDNGETAASGRGRSVSVLSHSSYQADIALQGIAADRSRLHREQTSGLARFRRATHRRSDRYRVGEAQEAQARLQSADMGQRAVMMSLMQQNDWPLYNYTISDDNRSGRGQLMRRISERALTRSGDYSFGLNLKELMRELERAQRVGEEERNKREREEEGHDEERGRREQAEDRVAQAEDRAAEEQRGRAAAEDRAGQAEDRAAQSERARYEDKARTFRLARRLGLSVAGAVQEVGGEEQVQYLVREQYLTAEEVTSEGVEAETGEGAEAGGSASGRSSRSSSGLFGSGGEEEASSGANPGEDPGANTGADPGADPGANTGADPGAGASFG